MVVHESFHGAFVGQAIGFFVASDARVSRDLHLKQKTKQESWMEKNATFLQQVFLFILHSDNIDQGMPISKRNWWK
jgi:hypothetical protein